MPALPLSQTQRYCLDVVSGDGFDPSWQHDTTALSFPGELDLDRAESLAGRLEERYPLLATRLAYRNGEPVVEPVPGAAPCTVMDLRGRDEDHVSLALSRWADEPFELMRGPLWRVAFARCDGQTIFAIVVHHLVCDAASVWLLAKALVHMYFDAPLEPEGPSYADFVQAERDLLAGPQAETRMAYWSEHLDGAVPTLLADGRPKPDELSSSQASSLDLGEGASAALQAAARARRVTPLPLLAATVLAAVGRASGQDDVLCGMVSDFRGQEFATTVGPFTDIMLVRDRHGRDADEAERLAGVRNAFFAGWQQRLPVAYLRRRLPHLRTDATGTWNPCDVFMNLLPTPPASEWQALVEVCGETPPAPYFMRHRLGVPPRRFHAPLFIFLFGMFEQLEGWIWALRRPELAELNAGVEEELRRSVAGMVGAAV